MLYIGIATPIYPLTCNKIAPQQVFLHFMFFNCKTHRFKGEDLLTGVLFEKSEMGTS